MKNNNAYEIYSIGDTFHNDNGENYIILNLDKTKDKALLAKKTSTNEQKIVHSSTLYIGARGLQAHSWARGHYFMSDFKAACDWFNEEE